jgi:hypothetical protein
MIGTPPRTREYSISWLWDIPEEEGRGSKQKMTDTSIRGLSVTM